MLVISRRENETISIGKDIKIRIQHIQRGSVKVAIQAPKDLPILRQNAKVRSKKS